MTTVTTVGVANWGPLVVGTDVDDQMIKTLQTWMPTYLGQLRKERNLPFNLALPRTYTNTFQGQEFLDHQLPAIVCTTANLQQAIGGPNATYQGNWQSLVACVVRGKRPTATRYLAAWYGGCVERCILQQAGEPEVCNDIKLLNARMEPVADATGNDRWLLASVVQFTVNTDKIVQAWAGPNIPDADVYVDEATVTEVDIEVLGETITITS